MSNIQIQEFQYPDGWYMKVGQIYSSPFTPYHLKIAGIEKEMDNDVEDEYIIRYWKLEPVNHDELYSNEESFALAWWFNEGYWNLEVDVD